MADAEGARRAQALPCCMCLHPSTKQCSGCRAFWYCSKECQRRHWKCHKQECGRTAELQQMTPKKLLQEMDERGFLVGATWRKRWMLQ